MTRNLTVRQLGIAAGVVALLFLAIWYVALFKPQTHKLTSAHKADAAAKEQISGLRQQVTTLRALEKEIPADQQKLAVYQKAIPADPQLSVAIRQIQAAATNTGVTMTSLAPVVPTAGSSSSAPTVSGAQTIPVTISATGNYGALTSFVRALDAMPRTLVVKSLSLSGVGNNMTESITSEMYFTGH